MHGRHVARHAWSRHVPNMQRICSIICPNHGHHTPTTILKHACSKHFLNMFQSMSNMQEQRLLRSTYRAMLRKFVAPLGRDEDGYVHWIKRATHIAEERAFALGFESFLDAFLRKKWHWAGHVAWMDSQRWARAAIYWAELPSGF